MHFNVLYNVKQCFKGRREGNVKREEDHELGNRRRNDLADLCQEHYNPLKTSLEAMSPLNSWLLR